MKRSLFARLFQNRFLPKGELQRQGPAKEAAAAATAAFARRSDKRWLRGVHKGNFFRINVVDLAPNMMQRFRNHATNRSKRSALLQHRGEVRSDPVLTADALTSSRMEPTTAIIGSPFQAVVGVLREHVDRARGWWWWWRKQKHGSTGVLLLFFNAGVVSLCCFTCMTMTNGSVQIYETEQNAVVNLSPQHADIYRRHMAPHGVTPQQFADMMRRARTVRLHAGDVLIRQGALMNRVFLVTVGQTRAHHPVGGGGGRRRRPWSLTTPEYHHAAAQQWGGASGSWVGERTFLEYFWNKNQTATASVEPVVDAGAAGVMAKPRRRRRTHNNNPCGMRALYTISAVQDNTIVLAWKYSEMEALLQESSDFQTSLTRAMSSAAIAVQAEEEEDLPKKVKIDRRPSFVLPESLE